MNALAYQMVLGLLRTTLYLAAANVLVFLLLKLSRCRSPRLHRAAWCAALLQGWLFVQIPWTITWSPGIFSEPPQATITASLHDVLPASGLPVVPRNFSSMQTTAPVAPLPEPTRVVDDQQRAALNDLLAFWPTIILATWLAGIIAIASVSIARYFKFIRKLPPSRAIPGIWQSEFEVALSAISPQPLIKLHISENLGPLLCRKEIARHLIFAALGDDIVRPASGYLRELRTGLVERNQRLRFLIGHGLRFEIEQIVQLRLNHQTHPLLFAKRQRSKRPKNALLVDSFNDLLHYRNSISSISGLLSVPEIIPEFSTSATPNSTQEPARPYCHSI